MEFFKQIIRSIGRIALRCLRWLFRRMPLSVYKVASGIFIPIGWPLLAKKRKTALENLQRAFEGEKSEEEIKQIAKEVFNHYARGMVDMIYWADRPEMMKENVTIEGKENLQKAFAEGSGAILVSAHFSNFILMYFRMVLEGYQTNVIMKRVRDPEFEKYISQFRDERGLKTIYDLPSRKCIQQSLKALRGNELLFILLDQNYGTDGRVFVDFFGTKAATASGPVVFANRTNAPVLPIFIEENGKDHFKIVIGTPIEMEQCEDDEEMIRTNVAKLTKVIEAHIRKRPQEWGGWMHKRWKTRTIEEQRLIDSLK